MFPSEVLVTPTVAGVPELVFGGCADAVEEEPPLLLRFGQSTVRGGPKAVGRQRAWRRHFADFVGGACDRQRERLGLG
jgi:hypothetical protein